MGGNARRLRDRSRLVARRSAACRRQCGGAVSLFGTLDGERRANLPGHEGGTNALAWMPGATTAAGPPPSLSATGGQDGSVKLWDAVAGQHTATSKLGTAWVEHLPGARASVSDIGVLSRRRCDEVAAHVLLFAAAGRQLTALRPDASIATRSRGPKNDCCARCATGRRNRRGVFRRRHTLGYRRLRRAKRTSPTPTAFTRSPGHPTTSGSYPATRIRACTSGFPTKTSNCT